MLELSIFNLKYQDHCGVNVWLQPNILLTKCHYLCSTMSHLIRNYTMLLLDVSHFIVFGSLCYVSTYKAGRTKLDPRAESCVFIGYSSNQKASTKYTTLPLIKSVFREMLFSMNNISHITNFSSTTPLFQFLLPTNNSDHIFYDPFELNYISSLDSPEPDSLNIVQPSSPSSPSPQSSPVISPSDIPSQTFPPPPRQSSSFVKPPAWMHDYVCNTTVAH